MSLLPGRRGDVLLVVDVQVDVMATCWQSARVIATIGDLVARARIAGTPVVWVRHQDGGLVEGTGGWQIVPQLVPEQGEQVVEKRYGDAFADTTLDDVLGGLGAGHVWLVGAQSDFCIRSTFFGGLYRGYDVTLVEDAHTTEPDSEGEVHLGAQQLVAVVNKLAWTTRLPGVVAAITPAAEVDFAAATAMDDEDVITALEADEQAEEDADDLALGFCDPDPDAPAHTM